MSPSLSLLPWFLAALAALAGAGLSVWGRGLGPRARPLGSAWPLVAATVSALAVLAGLAWRGWLLDAWPGATLPDGLALFAFGALATFIAAALIVGRMGIARKPDVAWVVLLASVAVTLAAALLLAALLDIGPPPARGRAWLYGVTGLVTGIGLGSLLAVLAASFTWAARVLWRAERVAPPPGLAQPYLPAGDPGRLPALFGYPWLTAGLVLVALWNLSSHAAAWRGAPGELWLLASWLLSSAYLHLTSGWRPLRLPAWLPTLIAGLAVAAGLAAALTLSSLLIE
jgi:hypothetical protein